MSHCVGDTYAKHSKCVFLVIISYVSPPLKLFKSILIQFSYLFVEVTLGGNVREGKETV